MPHSVTEVLAQQLAYYRARADEYDEWFLRRGRYDYGAEHTARWFAEVDEVVAALDAFGPKGDVLELACGTGLWTTRLARYAASLTAVDAAPEVLSLNRERLQIAGFADRVAYVEADLFAWEPPSASYDVVFFSFWLSHVPPARFDAFWALVRRALRPGGRAFFIDSRREPTSTANDQRLPDTSDATTLTRRLNDGRAFEIVKVFYEPDTLAARLAALGWTADVRTTESYFLYGEATLLKS